ncbi:MULTISPECIES: hypothetical protein [Streptomyces]|uniref:hypothetical protein n=1 Tax=Streptomyces TaxID=1883 RepID=UPI003135EDD9
MSTPPPPPPQGFGPAQAPYGQQPPPSPYAPPQHPGQAPPQGQYAPFPAAPGPAPWGGQYGGPPQGGRRTGKILGIVGGVVGAVIVILVALAVIGSTTDAGFPEAKYRLRMPGTLLNGTYKLAQDLSDTAGRKVIEENKNRSNVRDPKAVVGQFNGRGTFSRNALVVSGMYGRFKDPGEARKDLMEGSADADGASVAVPARDITPKGSDLTVRCQVLKSSQNGVTSNVPLCAWADDNTGAAVGLVTPESATQDPDDIDLDKLAETTLRVREEMREPIG